MDIYKLDLKYNNIYFFKSDNDALAEADRITIMQITPNFLWLGTFKVICIYACI
jgi:hypothetical protein